MKTTTTRTHHCGPRTAVARLSLTSIICLLLLCFARPSHAAINTTGDVDPGDPATWTSSTDACIGYTGNGTMDVNDGDSVSSFSGCIGYSSGTTGAVTVAGTGSTWISESDLIVAFEGDGSLDIGTGGTVFNLIGTIGVSSGTTGTVTVDGTGSTWINDFELMVGVEGDGTVNITNGGLVTVDGPLTIDPLDIGSSFLNMADGGMLALNGEADASLDDFLDLVEGADAIRYWDDTVPGWADISGATESDDYTLTYLNDGDMAGYTLLTVTTPVPEPSNILLLCLGAFALQGFGRRRN